MSGFRQVWAELLNEGWSSKRPTGLEVDHTYLRPGKTKKDKRGVDFFVGAQELMVYLDKLALGTHGTICGWRIALSDSNGALVGGIHQPAAAKTAQRNAIEQSHGTVQETMSASPPAVSNYFMTPGLWDDIATASEDYFVDKIDERVNEQYQKQVAREQKKPGYRRQTHEQIRVKLEQTPPITGRDLCVFIGLLVARTISPNKEKLQHHWKTTDESVIPRGCFGRFMTRDRFAHVSRNLHFSSNTDPRAATDRAWKLRPVIEALQETFRAGYMPPPVMAFDEAMFPSRSSFNRMRVSLLYVSALALQLWTMGYYSVGTVQTHRKGLAAQIVPPKKAKKKEQSRPAGIERGTFTYGESSLVPRMRTTKWWDNRPVYLLSIGGSTELDRIVRRAKSGVQEEVVCPRIVKDNQAFMGGVDVHDQLRLQSSFQEYYKSLFIGFVDLALVNALIVFNHARAAANKTKLSHVAFLKQLHLELCQISVSNWEELLGSRGQNFTPTKQRAAAVSKHMPIQTVDTRRGNTDGSKKRRQKACKVCSLLKEKVTGGDTSFQCSACKLKTINQKTGEVKESPVYLCNKVKHSFDGQARTCFEIWHTCWRNGTFKPSRGKRKLRVCVTEDGEESAADDEGTPQPQRRRVVVTTSISLLE
ncbi:unnamed protein product [Phytophthora fragariaefolia]|uniref:Unnamed protein product n=1 Tax=Phytophthora fragariaefolia TaxID=1490495 RepID=A0A9W6Y2A9_9STRA|nr:unnamed protein product [Phytophthora fragariaefolia]